MDASVSGLIPAGKLCCMSHLVSYQRGIQYVLKPARKKNIDLTMSSYYVHNIKQDSSLTESQLIKILAILLKEHPAFIIEVLSVSLYTGVIAAEQE